MFTASLSYFQEWAGKTEREQATGRISETQVKVEG